MIKFRSYKRKDLPHEMKWWRNPNVTRFFNDVLRRKSLKRKNKWFDNYKKDKSNIFFTILFNNKPIGMVGLTNIHKANKSASVFIIIGDDKFHNRKIGRQSVKFITDHGFKKLKLHKIKISVCTKNIPAIKCYKAAGFKTEAILKDEFFINDQFKDELVMAIFEK